MTKDPRNDRWVCPNDRNLQLRSKLNTGWSYHTGKRPIPKKDPQLTERELIEIQKVLQRSEMVERNERDRVLKLVERLENMKRNVTKSMSSQAGSSSGKSGNRCSLCGDYFCLIRSMPTHCNFCRKLLCSKCCIETQYYNENNNDSSCNHSLSRRSSITSMCSNSSSKTSIYLCRLCSEQREFLKKSGAWFLKKYPSYIPNGGSGETINSSPILNQIEQTSTTTTTTLKKPKNIQNLISQNISTSSSFRSWSKNKDQSLCDFDNISDLSIDTDLTYQNDDVNSFLNLSTTSNENIQNSKSSPPPPISPKDCNNSIKHQTFNFTSNELNTSLKNSNTSTTNTTFSDEETFNNNSPNSPNMNSYNYYSNIINNLKTDENEEIPVNSNFKKNSFSNKSKKVKSISTGGGDESSLKKINNLEMNSTAFLVNPETVANLFNFPAPNTNMGHVDVTETKMDSNGKLFKKSKILEWCSNQLSFDKSSKHKNSKTKINENDNNTPSSNSNRFKFTSSNKTKSLYLSPSSSPKRNVSNGNKFFNIENSMPQDQNVSANNLANSFNKFNLNSTISNLK